MSADRDGLRPWHQQDDRVERIQISELLRSVDLASAVAELDAGRDPQTPLVRQAAAEAARGPTM